MGDKRAEGGATLNDVAREAGVSRQTVSNVLNAPERVRPDTSARVRQAIQSLGYRPHVHARNLKSQASRCIGYQVEEVSPDAINPVLDRFLHGLASAARAHGYHVVLFTSEPGQDGLALYEDLHGSRVVDGFVFSEVEYGDPRVGWLHERGIPAVSFGRADVRVPHVWVDVDGGAGMRAAVAHLAGRGRRRVAFVGWPEGSATGDRRAEGYRAGLSDAGLAADPALDVRISDSVESGGHALDTLLDAAEPPDAVVAVSDLLAIGVLRRATQRGVAVPRDLAVVGFDDTPVARLTQPPLTSLRQPLEDAAHACVSALTGLLAGASPGPDGTLLEPELVVRASTPPAP